MHYRQLVVMLLACMIGLTVNAMSIQKGSIGEDVMRLQSALIESGYLARTADGEFGSTTEKALRLWQRDHGQVVTGAATEAIIKDIETVKEHRDGGGILFAPGNLGDGVVVLQKLLAKAGYFTENADGQYGSNTTTAVQHFQRDLGVEVIGAIDEVTWKALGGYREESVSRGMMIRRDVEREQLQELVKGTNDTKGRDNNKTDLVVGDTGKQVLQLQRLLIRNGYNPGVVDAHFGANTESALKAWQKAHGVAITGVANDYFWEHADVWPGAPKKYQDKFTVESTAYTAHDADTTNRTARGSILSHGHVAVDPNVIPLGSLIYVEGYGYGVADDIGGAIQNKHIDVAMESLDEAYQWGRRHVEVYIVSRAK